MRGYLIRQAEFHTLNCLAIPSRHDLVDTLSDGPVLVIHLDKSHSELSSMPSSLDGIRTTACDRFFLSSTDDNGLCANRRKSVDVSAQVNLDDIVLGQCQRRLRIRAKGNETNGVRYSPRALEQMQNCSREGREVGHSIVHGNRCRESNP